MIINEAMASQLWPRGSAIGRRFASAERVPVTSWYTVVGVVSDVRPAASLGTPTTRYQVYQPLRWAGRPMLAVRTTGSPEALASSLRRVIAELDPSLPRDEIHTAQALVERGLNNYTLIGWTLFGFAGLGLVLSALGVYGLFTGWVLQRTREIGVRVALGAQSQQVLGLILGKGLRLALLGGALGIAGAMLVAPLLNAAAPELPAHNPGAVMVLALLLVAVAVFACWLPARRAAHVDPMVALRSE